MKYLKKIFAYVGFQLLRAPYPLWRTNLQIQMKNNSCVDLLQITLSVAAEQNKKGQIEQGRGIEKTTNFLTNGQNSPI